MPPQALRHDDIQGFRDRVVEIATALFAERGYGGVTYRALADGLGCSAMTPYRYFRDKDEIFAAVRTAAYGCFAASQEKADDESLDPLERLAVLGQAYVRFGAENADAYQLMFALRQPHPGDYPELRSAELRARSPLRAVVQAAVDSGDLAGDAEELAHICWAGVHGVVSLHLAGKLDRLSVEDLAGPMIQTLIAGNGGPARGV